MTDTRLPCLSSSPPPHLAHRPVPVTRSGLDCAARSLASADWSVLGLWGEAAAVHLAARTRRAARRRRLAALSRRDLPSIAAYAERDPLSAPSSTCSPRPARRRDGAMARTRTAGEASPRGAAGDAERLPGGTRRRLEFLGPDSDELHQIAVGPVHAGIITRHFRFHANGETVAGGGTARYVTRHRTVDGRPHDRRRGAARRAHFGRQHGSRIRWPFGRAVEAATAVARAPRRLSARVMAELERLANHLGISRDLQPMPPSPSCWRSAASCARWCCAGAALLWPSPDDGPIVPGGVAADLTADGCPAARPCRRDRRRFATLGGIYESRPSLLDRTVGPASSRPISLTASRPEAMSDGPAGAASTRGATRLRAY